MKKITKLLLMTAIAIGMVACSNDDVPPTPESLKGSTYASIAITLPKAPSTRALPEDYNNKLPDWEGIDAIKTITVFLVNTEAATPSVDHTTFTEASFEGVDSQGILFPKLALKATPGENVKAYVVLNGESTILSTLQGTSAAGFDGVYNGVMSKIASELAKNVDNKDVIMMTNTVKPKTINIQPNITESEAMTGSANTFFVDVERVVSRAITTVKAGTHTINVLNYLGEAGTGSTITVQSLSYVVGQSNKEFYMIKQDEYKTPETVYDFVPTADDWMAAVKGDDAIFDNEGLESPTEVIAATGADALDKFKGALEEEGENSKFVLPVTHDGAANYKKGNTTFFEVIATFTPDKVDGNAYTSAGASVFLGMNDGLFYSTRGAAETSGQTVTEYKGNGTNGAIMKYVLWLNPDKIPGETAGEKASMSPTVRNQVYHAHINSFKKIGLPNNPLNPDDPMNPDPEDPTAPGNENPINPIKPEDPLQTDDTYLSVQITVRPWGIHSYEIDLGNYY